MRPLNKVEARKATTAVDATHLVGHDAKRDGIVRSADGLPRLFDVAECANNVVVTTTGVTDVVEAAKRGFQRR
jgi:hypothetical protein